MASNSTEKIKRILLHCGTITKPELSKATGLTTATCGYVLNDLLKKGEIVEEKFRMPNGGRPARSYRYNAKNHQYLCLCTLFESGSQTIYFRIFDAQKNLLERGEFRERRIDAKTIRKRIQKILFRNPRISSIAIGIQGGVNGGTVEFCDFPELDGTNLGEELYQTLKIPVRIENDMNAIALGYSQKNSEERNVAILFVPKGNPPAGGFLVDGNILRGNANLAGELSYFPFPFQKQKQVEIFSDLSTAFPYLLQVLLATVVFIDPAVIVFTGGFAKELSTQGLNEKMHWHLNRPNLPHLVFLPNSQEEYFSGLAKIAAETFLKSQT